MDQVAANTRQRDEQWGAVPEVAATAPALALLLETHTCLPGIIRSFDAATTTVTVQAAIKRQFIVDDGSDGWVELPLMVDVPVLVYGGGDLYLTFPIAPGDECLLHFSERAIDFWWDRGGVQEPSEYRLHDYSDAFAVVGPLSRPRMLSGYSTTGAELRTRDGTTVLSFEPGKIIQKADAVFSGGELGAQSTVNETYRTSEDTMLTALAAFLSALITNCTGVSDPAHAVIAINTIGPAANVLLPQVNAFLAGASGYLTTKTKLL